MAEFNFDSAKIRSQERQLHRLKQQLSASCVKPLAQVQKRLEGEITGRAADALTEQVQKTQRVLTELEESIHSVQSALSQYAQILEEADERLARAMGSKGNGGR